MAVVGRSSNWRRRGQAVRVARARGEAGVAVIMTALCLLPLMAFAAFGVDLASFYSRAAVLQKAADAASLAGTVWMPDLDQATTEACASLLTNGIDGGDCGTGPYGVTSPPRVDGHCVVGHDHRSQRPSLLLERPQRRRPEHHPLRRGRVQPPPPPRQPPQLLRWRCHQDGAVDSRDHLQRLLARRLHHSSAGQRRDRRHRVQHRHRVVAGTRPMVRWRLVPTDQLQLRPEPVPVDGDRLAGGWRERLGAASRLHHPYPHQSHVSDPVERCCQRHRDR